MRIYTSYFANAKNLHDKSLVSIANSTPKLNAILAKKAWPSIVPDWTTIVQPIKAGQITEEEYAIRYMKQLEQIDVCRLFNWFLSISRGKDVVLLCYETPDKFCHRHILAKWLNEAIQDAGLMLDKIEEL